MNKISEKSREKIILYILAPLTVGIIVYITYGLKNIYPFGRETIDYYDMGQEVMAFYYHIYDYLHGLKSPFYDWYTGLGMNMAAGTSGCSNFSPFNIFFLFVKRDHLLESMSLFLAIKLMLMSLSYSYVVNKISPKAPLYVKFILSIGYGLCGYVMMHYTIMTWLDIAAVFPIIIAFLMDTVKSGKMAGYTIALAVSFMMSYYLTIMILIYIFMSYGLHLIVKRFVNKDKSVNNTLPLGVGTLLGLIIASVIVLPHLLKTLGSTRYENNLDILNILSTTKAPYQSRWWALLGTAFAFSIIAIGIINDIKNIKYINKKNINVAKNTTANDEVEKEIETTRGATTDKPTDNTTREIRETIGRIIWIAGMILIACAELFFENINLLMHFGSYVHYPIRNGFVIYFTVSMAASAYAGIIMSERDGDNIHKKQEKSCSANAENIITYAILLTSVLVSAGTILYYKGLEHIEIGGVVNLTFKIAGVFTILFLAAVLFGNKKLNAIVLPIAFIMQLLIYAYLFIGPISFISYYAEEPEQTGEYIRISNEAVKKFDINNSFTDRIKNPDESLNTNYGFVMQRPSLSNMTHLVSASAQQGSVNMGYSIQYTRLLDAGGTVFTDALMHITNVISCIEMPEGLYEKTGEAMLTVNHLTGEEVKYQYYKSRYILPFGLTVSDDKLFEEFVNSGDLLSANNFGFGALVNGLDSYNLEDEDKYVLDGIRNREFARLVSIVNAEDMSYRVEGNKAVYFWGTCADQEYMNTSINVNGKDIAVPTIGDSMNIQYPAHFNNGTICLGSFEDEEISIIIKKSIEKEEDNYLAAIVELDLDMLDKLCYLENKYNKNTCVINGNKVAIEGIEAEGDYILLPISYDDGFTAKKKGTSLGVVNVNGLFTAVRMGMSEVGESDIITMSFRAEGLILGIICSVLGIITLVIIKTASGKIGIPKAVINNINKYLSPLYILAWSAVLLVIYIIPACYCIILMIKG